MMTAAAIAGVVTDEKPKCWRCGRILAWVVTRPWRLSCNKCKAVNTSTP